MSIPEYCSVLRTAFLLLEELKAKKSCDVKSDDDLRRTRELEVQVSELCSTITQPQVVDHIKQKLEKIRKKRECKRRKRLNDMNAKKKRLEFAQEQSKKIDLWINSIREKDLQKKREIEMKKEADNILSEVRKKILEAKRTIEKLNVLEKFRKDRRSTSLQRGLFASSKNDLQFNEKMLTLKALMRSQLNDYEAEEKALSVMLETEQEDQREEEQARRLRKWKELQEKKHSNILKFLFQSSKDPLPSSDAMFLFRQYYTRAYDSVENLLQMRCQWDRYLVPPGSEGASTIPCQYVVPDKLWDVDLKKSNS